jgi:hypothetical protein
MQQESFYGKTLGGPAARKEGAIMSLIGAVIAVSGLWLVRYGFSGAQVNGYSVVGGVALAPLGVVFLLIGANTLIRGFSPTKPMINYVLDDRGLVIFGGPDTPSADLFSVTRSGAKPVLIPWEQMINLAPTTDPKQVALFFWVTPPTGDKQKQVRYLNATLASPGGATVAERLGELLRLLKASGGMSVALTEPPTVA